jgi:hypothetical protein
MEKQTMLVTVVILDQSVAISLRIPMFDSFHALRV